MFGLSVRLTGPLAIMPSADRVPVKSSHSTMLWPMWVVLITGSTGSALRAVGPFQPSHRAYWRDLVPRRFALIGQVRWVPCSAHLGHHCPGHARDLVGKGYRGDFRWSVLEQSRKPWAMFGAVDLGIADDRQRARREQAAQITISLLGDAAELLSARTRVLLRD